MRGALAALGPQPALAPGVPAEMDALGAQREALGAALETRRTDIEGWTAARGRLVLDDRAGGLADALAGVQPLRARAQNSAEDLPRRQDELDRIAREIARLLGEVGLTGADPATFGLTGAGLDRLDAAAVARDRAARQLEDAGRERDAAEATLGRLRGDAPPAGEAGGDPQMLEGTLRKLDAVRLASAVSGAQATLAAATDTARQSMAALTIGGRSFAVPGPVPLTAEGAEALAAEIGDLSRRVDQLEERLAEEARQAGALEAERATLLAQGAAPDDAEAAALRGARDRLWDTHHSALTPQTAAAYAAARAADDQAGALRLAEAARLADLQRTERDHARAVADRDARAGQRDAAVARMQAAEARLAGVLDEIGLPSGLGAGALAQWLKAHQDAAMAHRDAAQAKAHAELALAQAAPVAQGLAEALDTAETDLPRLVDMAQKRIEAAQAQAALRAAADRALAEAEAASLARQAALDTATAEHDTAAAELDAALAQIGAGLPPDIPLGAAVPVLRALLAALDKHSDLQDRVGKMEAAFAEFGQRVAVMAAPWPELAGKPALEQAAALDRIADTHRRTSERRHDLAEEIASAEAANTDTARRLREVEARADEIALAWDAGARPSGFAAIEAAIGAATQAAQLSGQIAKARAR